MDSAVVVHRGSERHGGGILRLADLVGQRNIGLNSSHNGEHFPGSLAVTPKIRQENSIGLDWVVAEVLVGVERAGAYLFLAATTRRNQAATRSCDYQRGSRGGRSTPDGSIANESRNPASASSAAVVGIIGIE
jgi:hypothetical protein